MFNDVAMFKVAGYSIAMGQAPKAVKDQATTVTGANTEEGFADAVDRLLAARAAKVPA
jgi:hydroxymethylpyrimidine pyrophosphatase-like HAD family hydrolase